MKQLPIGKQVFRTLIEDNFIYVDKTPFLVELANSGIATFLSRPRRFGKSLTVSTFKELFLGNKELFKNTYAYNNWNWEKKSPVIKLDMSVCTDSDPKIIEEKISAVLQSVIKEYNLSINTVRSPLLIFREIIEELAKESKVVILIDEYDAPILDSLHKDNLQEVKELLRSFYKVLKEQEEHIRFIFITGISKFSKVGVFSALNNLNDITLSPKYSAMAGYTKEEINTTFSEYTDLITSELSLSETEFEEQLNHYYNGYSWDGKKSVYNPFSVLQLLEHQEFAPYWMETGSPSFMIRYAENNHLKLDALEGVMVDKFFLSERDIDEASPESFLFQAGYLTIKESNPLGYYVLDFPNYEVRTTFNHLLLKSACSVSDHDLWGIKLAMLKALSDNNTEAFLLQIKAVYTLLTHHHYDANKNEYFYSALLLMFFQAAGFDAVPEKTGAEGRMDIVLSWQKRVYIFELKIDSAQKALRQIKEKNYAGQYTNFHTILIGLKVDIEKRSPVEWAVEDSLRSHETN